MNALTLQARLLELKQGHNEYGYNGLLMTMPDFEASAIDQASIDDAFVALGKENILQLLKSYTVGYSEQLKSAFDIFVELSVYLQLKERNLSVYRVPETAEARPDLRLDIDGREIFLEIKALGWAKGRINHDYAIANGLDAQVSLEEQVLSGAVVAQSETLIAPLGTTPESVNCPPKYFVEILIAKINQNIKSGQFSQGPTILLCDLASLQHPSDAHSSSVTVFPDAGVHSVLSGELWHVAFGRLGDPMLRAIEFEGKENLCGRLASNGILVDRPEVKALVFRLGSLSNERTFAGFVRADDMDELADVLHQIVDF